LAETKYGKHVIREPLTNDSPAVFFYDNRDNIGVTFEYRCVDSAGWAIEESHAHETWELLCFLGGVSGNILDLGASVGVCLGDEGEENNISTATVVSIPPGLKHGPVSVKEYRKPFVFLRISTTKEYEVKKAGSRDMQLRTMMEGSPVTKDGKKYWMNIIQGPFYREREPGYNGMSISAIHNEYRSGTTLGYHSIYPGYLAPVPHAHTHAELLCFLGGDPENVRDLNAEVSVCLGEEQEKHTFNTATIVSIPPELPHCPVTVKNAAKPVIFLVICTTEEKVDVG
jgi:hypothetical protein